MSTSIAVRPLFTEANAPYATLQKIDDYTILLDCGWSDSFKAEDLEVFRSIVTEIDCVLLTFPLLEHIGALPYLVETLGLSCPVYATKPVCSLGKLAQYDACVSRGWDSPKNLVHIEESPEGPIVISDGVSVLLSAEGGRPRVIQGATERKVPWDLDSVDRAFDQIISVEFQRDLRLHVRGVPITMSPFAAGRALGGCFWRIDKEGVKIVYAVGFHHLRDELVDPCVLESTIENPSLLITEADLSMATTVVSRKRRDELFIQSILHILEAGGRVILPVELSRAAEVALLLDSLAETTHKEALKVPIQLASPIADSYMRAVKDCFEFCNVRLHQKHTQGTNPLAMPHIIPVTSIQSIEQIISTYYFEQAYHRSGKQPAIVICTDIGLENSIAGEQICKWGSNPNNLVQLNSRPTNVHYAEQDFVSQIFGRCGVTLQPTAENGKTPIMQTYISPDFNNIGTVVQKPQQMLVHRVVRESLREDEMEAKEISRIWLDDQQRLQNNLQDESESDDDSDTEVVDNRKMKTTREADKKSNFVQFSFSSCAPERYDKYGLVSEASSLAQTIAANAQIMNETSNANRVANPVMKLDDGPTKRRRTDALFVGGTAPVDFVTDTCYKLHSVKHEQQLQCKVVFIDRQGRCDAQSLQKVIDKLSADKVVLCHGFTPAKERLAKSLQKLPKDVLLPTTEELMRVHLGNIVHQLTLSEQIVGGIQWNTVGDYRVAKLNAQVADATQWVAGVPVLLACTDSQNNTEGAYLLSEGEILLSTVNEAVTSQAMPANLYGGVLVCGTTGNVEVYKDHNADFVIESMLSDEAYKIRDIMYSKFKFV